MAIAQPTKVKRISVPRQNAQRLGLKMTAELHKQAKAKRVRIDTYQNPTLSESIESASDWNSMLMTARAERGPQWDIGTQQFLVDKGSELYYDPTELIKLTKPEDNHRASASDAKQHQRLQQQRTSARTPPQQIQVGPPRGGPSSRDFAPMNMSMPMGPPPQHQQQFPHHQQQPHPSMITPPRRPPAGPGPGMNYGSPYPGSPQVRPPPFPNQGYPGQGVGGGAPPHFGSPGGMGGGGPFDNRMGMGMGGGGPGMGGGGGGPPPGMMGGMGPGPGMGGMGGGMGGGMMGGMDMRRSSMDGGYPMR